MELTGAMDGFVQHWGEMGMRWGINRTIAQIHALLYLSPNPLTAEEIAETLDISMGTVKSRIARAREELQESLKKFREQNGNISV